MASAKPVTYRRLLSALRVMRFKRDAERSAKEHVTLARPGSDVPIILPVLPAAAPVAASHLAMVRVVLRETGSGDEEQLDLLLGGPVRRELNGQHPPHATPDAPRSRGTRAVK